MALPFLGRFQCASVAATLNRSHWDATVVEILTVHHQKWRWYYIGGADEWHLEYLQGT